MFLDRKIMKEESSVSIENLLSEDIIMDTLDNSISLVESFGDMTLFNEETINTLAGIDKAKTVSNIEAKLATLKKKKIMTKMGGKVISSAGNPSMKNYLAVLKNTGLVFKTVKMGPTLMVIICDEKDNSKLLSMGDIMIEYTDKKGVVRAKGYAVPIAFKKN